MIFLLLEVGPVRLQPQVVALRGGSARSNSWATGAFILLLLCIVPVAAIRALGAVSNDKNAMERREGSW